MKHFHARKHHHLNLSKHIHSDLWRFDFSIWLQTFARSMVGIFIPILLLQLDYTVREVILFYLVYDVIDTPLNFVARAAVKRIGALRTIVIGNAAVMLFFVLFTQLTLNNWELLLALAALIAIFDTFYWIGHLFIFMEVDRRKKDTGKDTGILEVVRQFGRLLGPIGGAALIIGVGPNWLLLFSAILLLIAMLPLSDLKQVPQRPDTKEMPLKEIMKDKPSLRDNIAEMFTAIEISINDVIWPMFIFITFSTVESVAWLAVIISISAMLFSYGIGTHATKYRTIFSFIGAIVLTAIWFGRLEFTSTVWIYGSVVVAGLFRLFTLIPLENGTYMRSKYIGPLQASTYRNFFGMIPNVFLFGVLYFVDDIFSVAFIIGGITMLCLAIMSLFFRPKTTQAVRLLK